MFKPIMLNQLQFLRFIAFCLIFILHQHFYWFSCKGNIFDCFGVAPVAFFFMLSGYLSAYGAYNKTISFNFKETFNYLVKKLNKFYPLYFITLVITLCYNSDIPQKIAANVPFCDYKKLVVQFFKDIFLVQSWAETGYFSYNGVGWFLSSIMFLYLMRTPILSLFQKIKNYKNSNHIFVYIILYCILWEFIYSYFGRGLLPDKATFWQYILPPARLFEYIAGMCLGMLAPMFGKFALNAKYEKFLFTTLEILSLGLWIAIMASSVPFCYKITFCWIIPCLFTLFIFTIGKGYISKLFMLKPFVFLGSITFECFILHQMIMNFYLSCVKIESYSFAGKLFSVLYCLFLTLAISTFIYIHRKKE